MALHNKADLQANFDRFVSRVQEREKVWGLKDADGWATCPSNGYDSNVYVFWSDEAYAKQHCKEDWSSYEPTPIALTSFLDNWLPGMDRDGFLVGVQFNADLAGLEVEPAMLAKEFGK